MCKGLAIIVEKIDNEWITHSIKGESSHDRLLHTLSDDLKYGKKPHLKFEVTFPNQIKDDIQQDVKYPEGFVEIKFGRKVAIQPIFESVSQYYYNHPELSEFNNKMLSDADLSGADLSGANLSRANLSGASLFRANLSDVSLFYADLSGADLSHADLSHANLFSANLFSANLSDVNLSYVSLSYANLSDANLSHANLSHANLSHANLFSANLSDANLSHAKYDKYTIFPEKFIKSDDMILI